MDRSPDAEEALARAVHTVYGAAPEEFVAVRKEEVARLRAEGLKEQAKQVGALRKPSVAAAAVNALVRADDPVVGRLHDLGARMRHAQSALDMAALAGLRTERDGLLAAWVAAARTHAPGGSLTPAVESEVRDTAIAALADAGATEVVTSGNLTRALGYSGFGEVDVADAVARTSTGVVLTRIDGGREEAAEEPGPAADGGAGPDEDESPDDADGDGASVEDEVDDEADVEAGGEVDDEIDLDAVDGDDAQVETRTQIEAGSEVEDEAQVEAGGEAQDEPPSSKADRTTAQTRSSAADRVAELEMELDEAEKVVAAARATRKSAAQADAEAEREVTVGQEQVAQAERLLAAARKHLEKAEDRRMRTQEALEAADRELTDSRARRDETRAALEEAEDA